MSHYFLQSYRFSLIYNQKLSKEWGTNEFFCLNPKMYFVKFVPFGMDEDKSENQYIV